ncbi:MAG TPA: hypothetical protein VD962_01795 [Rubricoccaceae bacterium]|nr:hypothetical protein [Rubricoccaceae bacterium]
MTVYEIKPNEGIGPVRFGMGRAEVRAALGEEPIPFQKIPEAKHAADEFGRAGLHVHYRDAERYTDPVVEFVEGFAVPGVRFTLAELLPLEAPAESVVSQLAAQTDEIEESDGALYVLPEWGLSLWRPDRTHERFATVGVAEPGYDRLAVV